MAEVQARLLDEDGDPAGGDEIGTLELTSGSLFAGYWAGNPRCGVPIPAIERPTSVGFAPEPARRPARRSTSHLTRGCAGGLAEDGDCAPAADPRCSTMASRGPRPAPASTRSSQMDPD